MLYALAADVIFSDVSKALTQQRGHGCLGLSPTKFEDPFPPHLYLDLTVPTFEYPHADTRYRCTSGRIASGGPRRFWIIRLVGGDRRGGASRRAGYPGHGGNESRRADIVFP